MEIAKQGTVVSRYFNIKMRAQLRILKYIAIVRISKNSEHGSYLYIAIALSAQKINSQHYYLSISQTRLSRTSRYLEHTSVSLGFDSYLSVVYLIVHLELGYLETPLSRILFLSPCYKLTLCISNKHSK